MDDKKQVYQALLEEADQLTTRVAKYDGVLATELKIVLRMMQRYIPQNGVDSQTNKNISESITKVEESKLVKPSQVLRRIFKENPDKEYSPAQLRDILSEVKRRGELIMRSKNLLVTTHTILRILTKKKFIRKIDKSDGTPVYQKV